MNCLLLGKLWPEPSSTAAGRRTQDVLTALQAVGWTVHFASAAQRGPHALDLEATGVQTHRVAVNDPAFDTWIAALQPDLVIFDRFMTEEQFGWRVAQACPGAARILDTSDLHCLRIARETALKKGGPLDLHNETALREIASIYRSDRTLMISDFEQALLQEQFGLSADLIAYWPFALQLPESVPDFAERAHCLMIGSFLHPPNLDAARACLQTIWPQIREALPEVELHIYGSYGERYAAELNRPRQGVHFKGRAADALQTMSRYRLNLAPLRYGAGLKGKVFDGFQTGTPTVLSPIAAEGMGFDPDEPKAGPADFAAEVVRLYADPLAWQARQSSQRSVAQARFAASRWQPRLPQIIEQTLHDLAANRQKNFIGQMLRHHQHRSTEFMSRWIEAKNAKEGR